MKTKINLLFLMEQFNPEVHMNNFNTCTLLNLSVKKTLLPKKNIFLLTEEKHLRFFWFKTAKLTLIVKDILPTVILKVY